MKIINLTKRFGVKKVLSDINITIQKGKIYGLVGNNGVGKTTLLRDLARQFSSGHDAVQTAIIDERSELAACVNGIPQLDVGQAVDVLDGLPKTEALPWLIRSMSPQMIITDEIGDQKDAEAIMEAASCGSAICASVHGATLQDTARRPALAALMSRRIFDYYIVLSSEGGGRISAMYDRTGNPVTIS